MIQGGTTIMEEKLQPFETKMSKSYEALLRDYATIRA